ncbi:hypothetical protein HK096_004897 [Nowakowskiella sp. JEL0078]|nr:hypothetical protein HK096_004897 [Nowakowskiella sp. JEL0078]
MWNNRALFQIGRRELNPAISRVKRYADAAVLDKTVYSVTAKSPDQVGPSNDMHDFYSLARYYWPGNQTNPLPYVRHDGYINPEIYQIPDSVYLKTVIDDIFTLGLAYFWSGNESYAQIAVKRLEDWFLNPVTKMNPNMEYANWIKGSNTSVSAFKPSFGGGLLDFSTVYLLIDGIGMIRNSTYLTNDVQTGMKSWFQEYFDWLSNSPRGILEGQAPNNQGNWYDVQRVSILLYLGKLDIASQVHLNITGRITSQIFPDGSQPFEQTRTLSWFYSNFNIDALMIHVWLSRTTKVNLLGFQTSDGRSILKGLTYLMGFAQNGGSGWPNLNIGNFDLNETVDLAKQAFILTKDTKYDTFAISLQRPQSWNVMKLWAPYDSIDIQSKGYEIFTRINLILCMVLILCIGN